MQALSVKHAGSKDCTFSEGAKTKYCTIGTFLAGIIFSVFIKLYVLNDFKFSVFKMEIVINEALLPFSAA